MENRNAKLFPADFLRTIAAKNYEPLPQHIDAEIQAQKFLERIAEKEASLARVRTSMALRGKPEPERRQMMGGT